MKKKIVLVGGGGHCCSCIDVIESTGEWSIFGIIDVKEKIGQNVDGYPIIGSDEKIHSIAEKTDIDFFVTIGHIKSYVKRREKYLEIKSYRKTLPYIIARSAIVSSRAVIGEGTIIMHNAFINCGVSIAQNSIVNTGAIVEHNTMIGSTCHISTGTVINGDAKIGDNCFIGSGAIVRNGISICCDCIIGAGTVVVKDIHEPGKYVGNPALKIT